MLQKHDCTPPPNSDCGIEEVVEVDEDDEIHVMGEDGSIIESTHNPHSTHATRNTQHGQHGQHAQYAQHTRAHTHAHTHTHTHTDDEKELEFSGEKRLQIYGTFLSFL